MTQRHLLVVLIHIAAFYLLMRPVDSNLYMFNPSPIFFIQMQFTLTQRYLSMGSFTLGITSSKNKRSIQDTEPEAPAGPYGGLRRTWP